MHVNYFQSGQAQRATRGTIVPTAVGLDTPQPGVHQEYRCAGGGTLLVFEDATAREDFIDVAADEPAMWITGEEWAYQAP